MLNVNDILTDLDVIALDATVLSAFGPNTPAMTASLADKRSVVVNQWLRAELLKAGFAPDRHSIRIAPDSGLRYTAGSYVDITDAIGSESLDDLDLTAALATPGTDYLYLRSPQPVRGLSVVMQESVNVNTLTYSSVSYWNGGKWTAFNSFVDGTRAVSSLTLSGGGLMQWALPTDWARRSFNDETEWGHWMRLTTSQALSATVKASQLLPMKPSVLTLPGALKTLSLVYGESWGAQQGEWREKAQEYRTMADKALASALTGVAEEFVTDGEEAVRADSDEDNRPDPGLFELNRG